MLWLWLLCGTLFAYFFSSLFLLLFARFLVMRFSNQILLHSVRRIRRSTMYTYSIFIQHCSLMFDREVDVSKHDQNECKMALCRVQYAFIFFLLPSIVSFFSILLLSIPVFVLSIRLSHSSECVSLSQFRALLFLSIRWRVHFWRLWCFIWLLSFWFFVLLQQVELPQPFSPSENINVYFVQFFFSTRSTIILYHVNT